MKCPSSHHAHSSSSPGSSYFFLSDRSTERLKFLMLTIEIGRKQIAGPHQLLLSKLRVMTQTWSPSHCMQRAPSLSSKKSTPSWLAKRGMYSMIAKRTRQCRSSANSTIAGNNDCDSRSMPITCTPNKKKMAYNCKSTWHPLTYQLFWTRDTSGKRIWHISKNSPLNISSQ